MQKYIMALDQGTTSSRCIIFDHDGKAVSMAQKEFTQIYPQSGWVEHDPMEILSTQIGVASEAMSKIDATYENIAAIGITNHRETAIVWDKITGEPVCNAIVWQCRRTAPICDKLIAKGMEKIIREKTGLPTDAYFSATKIRWILDNIPGAKEKAENGQLLFGTVDCWLIWKMTKGKVHVTDCTNASRTMLFNIHTMDWDDDLLKMLDIPRSMLPEVKPSSCIYGETEVFGGKIKISGAAGDQHCALFGQHCFSEGDVKNTYGTGCFLLMNTGDKPVKSENGLITTVAWGIGDKVTYALEGSIFVGGAVVQWLRDEMRLISTAAETEQMALSVDSSEGVYIVPAFTGLGAPYWDPYARGIITGLSRGSNRNHIVRAALEGIAYQVYDVLTAMEQDSRISLSCLKVDGGASANGFLMQFQSDIAAIPVSRPASVETTALGAAYFAGLAVGYWNGIEELKKTADNGTIFSPAMPEDKRQNCISGWKKAVKRALN